MPVWLQWFVSYTLQRRSSQPGDRTRSAEHEQAVIEELIPAWFPEGS